VNHTANDVADETYDDRLKKKEKIFVKIKQRTRRGLGAFPRVPL